MQHKLPPELFEAIICHIGSTSDLYNLLFVSRLFRRESERFLYQNMFIDEERCWATFSGSLSNPRLARLVRRLEIISRRHTIEAECLQSLHSTLHNFISLDEFIIEGDLSFGADRNRIYLLEHATTSLRSISFRRIEVCHIPLLEKQKQLRELTMQKTHRGDWELQTAFPRLAILGCGGYFMPSNLLELPSNVSRLQWRYGFVLDPHPPFYGIRSLDLFRFRISADSLVRMIQKFPSLEYLKCSYHRSDENIMASILVYDESFTVC